MSKPFRILFVCLGNICRSPAAEGVMRHLVEREGLRDGVEIDSAGTGDWHTGDLPDARMRQHAAKRGYLLTSRARQVRTEDFAAFDLFVAMDRDNLRNLRDFAGSGEDMNRVKLFCEFTTGHSRKDVPDPYYGGPDGFGTVLDLVENGCAGILRKIREDIGS